MWFLLLISAGVLATCTADIQAIEGYSLFPGVGFYKYYRVIKAWGEAWKQCDDDGGHLVVINSEVEAQVVRQLLTGEKPQHYIYIGFHKHYNSDTFLTVEGKRLEYSGYYKWAPGKPSSDSNHKCGAVYPSALLVNKDCTGKWYFICEHELKCSHNTVVSVLQNWG